MANFLPICHDLTPWPTKLLLWRAASIPVSDEYKYTILVSGLHVFRFLLALSYQVIQKAKPQQHKYICTCSKIIYFPFNSTHYELYRKCFGHGSGWLPVHTLFYYSPDPLQWNIQNGNKSSSKFHPNSFQQSKFGYKETQSLGASSFLISLKSEIIFIMASFYSIDWERDWQIWYCFRLQ